MKTILILITTVLSFSSFSQKTDSIYSYDVNKKSFSIGLNVLPYFQNNGESTEFNASAIYTTFSWRVKDRVNIGFRPFYVKTIEFMDQNPKRYYGVGFFYRYDFYQGKKWNAFADATVGFAAMRESVTSLNREQFVRKDIAFISNFGIGVDYQISKKWSAEAMVQYVLWNFDLGGDFAKGFMPTIGVKYKIR